MEKKKFKLTEEYKQNAFKTPEGYFEAMQDRLTARVTANTQSSVSWWGALRPQLAFAAGFVALVAVGYGGMHLLNSVKSSSSDTVHDDLYAYAADMLHVDEQTVLRLMSEEKRDSSVDTDAIINYLADAHLSLSDIASLY